MNKEKDDSLTISSNGAPMRAFSDDRPMKIDLDLTEEEARLVETLLRPQLTVLVLRTNAWPATIRATANPGGPQPAVMAPKKNSWRR
jgi:hypothetical protein